MTYVNSKLAKLPASATLAVKTKAGELRAAGKQIVDLSAGEPDIDTPAHIKEAAVRAMEQGKTKYTPVPGTPEARAAVAKKLTEENCIPTDPADVIITNGGKQALSQLFFSCLEPGDEVIIPAPYWVSYVPMVELAGGVPVVIPTTADNGYRLTPTALEAALTEKTKMFVMNSPSNPTGAAYSQDQLRAIGEVLLKTNVLVVSDEVYEKICFGDFQFASFAQAVPALVSRTVTVNALSKTFSMTGWRVGYATGPREIIKAMTKLQGQSTSNVCSVAQAAAIAALEGPMDFLQPLILNYSRRMDKAISSINAIPGLGIVEKPQGAFYLFVRMDQIIADASIKLSNSVEIAAALLDSGVAVVPGGAFGDEGAFRISVSLSDEQLEEGLAKLEKGIRSL